MPSATIRSIRGNSPRTRVFTIIMHARWILHHPPKVSRGQRAVSNGVSMNRALQFLELLEQSKLLDGDQLAKARSWCDRGETLPQAIAAKLVKRRYITQWQAGQLLAGKRGPFFLGNYELLRPLGSGAMGSVFKSRHAAMPRVVALKVMSRRLLDNRRALTRFKREIRAAAALDHPHIIHALDAGCVNNTYFLVMEYAGGHDLKHRIAASGKLPVAWSCECIRQAALGLQYAYERGIVHRDIKPSNLLLIHKSIDVQPLIKIADFGLARAALDVASDPKLTRVGQGVGTSDYIAPEQASGETQAGIRSDIFSLGCTLFELLSGQLPFQGTTQFERLMARFKQDAPLVDTLRPDISCELAQIVARMLARDTANRFQTPAEVAVALLPFSLTKEARSAGTEGASHDRPTLEIPPAIGSGVAPEVHHFLESLSTRASEPSVPTVSVPRAHQRSLWRLGMIAVFMLILLTIIFWAMG